MTVEQEARAATGLDLSDVGLVADVLAPRFAKRLEPLYHDIAVAQDVAQKLYQAYRNLVGATTVLGVLQVAYAAVSGALTSVYAAASKTQRENLERRQATRNGFVRGYYRPGSFSQVLSSSRAPSPKNLDLTRNLKKPRTHLDQYDRDYVWHVSRVGRSQTLWPTWSTRPYDSPGGSKETWENGYTFAEQMLGGYRGTQFATKPRAIGPIPARYADKYWGNAPGGGNVDANNEPGEWGRVDWAPLDAAVFISGYAPPPGYDYLFSWGTYPYTSWTTLYGLDALRRHDECADLAGLAGAIHGITPIHARISWNEVETCYRHFLSMTQWRSWPEAPTMQVDSGLYIHKGLPFSPVPNYPVVIGPYQVPWEVVQDIEVLFRDWFRIRTAVLYQFDRVSEGFRAAAAQSTDPVLRSLAAGGRPPEWRGFVETDPLGDNWQPGTLTPRPKYDTLPKLKPKGQRRSRGGGAAALGAAVATAGLLGIAIAAGRGRKRT